MVVHWEYYCSCILVEGCQQCILRYIVVELEIQRQQQRIFVMWWSWVAATTVYPVSPVSFVPSLALHLGSIQVNQPHTLSTTIIVAEGIPNPGQTCRINAAVGVC